MTDGPDASNGWDPDRYEDDHAFVAEYGESVLDLLDPQSGECVLDLGCGPGDLTAAIQERGADAVGVDAAASMVDRARERHPSCEFVQADARSFADDAVPVGGFDAVFSNAALHWIPEADQDDVLSEVHAVLAPGGRFVAELGGVGNVQTIETAVRDELRERGYGVESPWYFPSIGAYTPRLEAAGFEVRQAVLFDRPTELDGGVESWLRMFGDEYFAALPEAETTDVIEAVADAVRPALYDDGTWVADYRRLRFVAVAE